MKAKRGRKSQIATASREAQELRRQAKALVTAISKLQSRLAMLDSFYGRQIVAGKRAGKPTRRGPNIRDLAAEILAKSKKPMSITILAPRVAKARGGKPGRMFAQNLGTALRGDRRFLRTGRGVYALRARGFMAGMSTNHP